MRLRDLIQFLGELSENNNRAWFVMNKPRYDILRAEFLELVTRLIKDIAKFDPDVAGCNPKKALFRINRDMRFSHDKSPYKTTFSAAVTASGLKKPSQGGGPAYYFHVDKDGTLLIAGGEYMPPADRLRTIRQYVVADAAGFGKQDRDDLRRGGADRHLGKAGHARSGAGRLRADAERAGDCIRQQQAVAVGDHQLWQEDDRGTCVRQGRDQ